MNPTKSEDVALAILNLVNDMDFNTGIKKLTQSLQGSTVPSTFKNSNYYSFLNIYNQDQITKIINELITKEYLKLFNIGMGYEIPIIKLTEKGFNAVKNKEPIMLDLPKIYMPQFAPANQIIESSIIDEFYEIRKKINELQIKEESLKERIKKTMLDNNIPKIVTDKINKGVNLEQAIDSLFGTKQIGEGIGMFGIMTKGVVTRAEGVKHGVAFALARFLHKEIYEK